MTSTASDAVAGAAAAGDDLSGRVALLAACLFALAVVLNVAAAATLAALGLALLLLSLSPVAHRFARSLSDLRLTGLTAAVALVAVMVPRSLNGAPPGWAIAMVPALAIAGAAIQFAKVSTGRFRAIAAGAILCAALVSGASLVQATKGLGVDVVYLHEQAAAALARGENPYGPAVSVLNGAPGVPPGSRIVGYPYPPIAALVYAGSTSLTGDPRWASLVLWFALAISMLALDVFRDRRGRRSMLPFLLAVALPGWGMMLQSGWTEMVTVGLLALAAASWRHPVLSGMALGAALGSKQYFVVALPLLVMYRGPGWKQRSAVAALIAALAVLPALAWNPNEAWRSLVLFHAHTAPRFDSSSLTGVLGLLAIPWTPPVWLPPGAAMMLVGLLARRSVDAAGFWRILAIGLATLFLLSSQTMPNYWYLVAVISILGSQVTRSGLHDPVRAWRRSAAVRRIRSVLI